MVVRQPVEITFGVACKGGRGAKTGPDLPPKKWTGLGRHIDGMDWSKCPDAESVPDRCSGQWVVKDTAFSFRASSTTPRTLPLRKSL
jgi:hypothetical protein